MSACKTGCGTTGVVDALCVACGAAWDRSDEFRRAFDIAQVAPASYAVRVNVALVDFCTRVRLERQNGGAK